MPIRSRIGIRGKFVLLIAGILILVFSFIALYLARTSTQSLRNSLYDEARSFATLATTPIGETFLLYGDSGTINIDKQTSDFAKLNKTITNIAVIDLDGSVVYNQHPTTAVVTTKEQAESFEPVYIYDTNKVLQTVVYPFKESSGVRRYSIVYNISSSNINTTVKAAILSVVVLSIVGLVITSTLLYFLVNYLLIAKVRKISQQSTLISSGQLDQIIAINSTDELGELAKSVNTMANSLKNDIEKLKELDKAKSEFMMITSHNIRTPLTIINGFVDSSASFNTVDQLRHALKQIQCGSKRLSAFAEDVLTISRLELGGKIDALESIDVSEFLSAVCNDFDQLTELKEVAFNNDLPPIAQRVMVNRPYMRAAVWNLLDNALKFTKKGGSITLAATNVDDHVEISVTDTGIGISPEEMQKLFTKFHRGTDTLNYDYEGTGIGLYATKMIVDRLNGEVRVQSVLGSGSCFTIILPYFKPEGMI